MKKNLLKSIFKFTLVFYFIIVPIFAFAQNLPSRNTIPSNLPSRNTIPSNLPSTQTVPNYTTFMPGGNNVCVGNNIGYILCQIHEIFNSVIPVLLALGVIYFVWGVVQYFIGSDEEAKKRGKNRIIFGIIGLTVIVSVWGIVAVIVNTFGLNSVQAPNLSGVNSVFDQSIQASNSCTLTPNPKLQNLLSYATCIITKSVIPLIFALAVLMFVWGVVQYVINTDEEAKKAKGRQFMIWGIIGLTVMVSIWGLVSVLGNTFNIDTNFVPQVR